MVNFSPHLPICGFPEVSDEVAITGILEKCAFPLNQYFVGWSIDKRSNGDDVTFR